MTTTKRCEVCEKPECEVGENCVKGFEHPALQCHGHSSPPPRPDEWEARFEKRFDVPVYQRELIAEAGDKDWRSMKDFIRAELLSYGKEREMEMWRKCREVVEKLTESGTFNELIITSPREMGMCCLSALDSVNPER